MRRAFLAALALPLLAACSTTLSQSEVLSVDSSANINPTANFAVQGSWDVTYNYDCAEQQSEGTAGANRIELDVINSDDNSLNSEHPIVKATGRSGSSTVHFHRGGTFDIKVVTPCSWRLSVDEVTS